MKNIRQMLSDHGLRFTRQRALILDIIRRGEGHQDADDVYRQARKIEPRLSLSTVYRGLQTFKKLGLIEELHFDKTHHHYEVKPTSEHHHLVCLGCGQITEFHHPVSRYIKRNVPDVKEFEIVDTEVHMTGYCPRCRERK